MIQMIRKLICVLSVLLLLFNLTCCTRNNKGKVLYDDIEAFGTLMIDDDTKIVLHFSTRQNTTDLSQTIRVSRAKSQFLMFDKNGNLLNKFSMNREVLCNPITEIKNGLNICYADFALGIYNTGYKLYDDSYGLNLKGMTNFGPMYTGKIENKNLSYYVLNLGTGAIEGQYTTILRIIGENLSYDVIIPHSVSCISYDEVSDRFIYRIRGDVEKFEYGTIDYDEKNLRYVINDVKNVISRRLTVKKYGDQSGGGVFLVRDNVVYSIIPQKLNKYISSELNITQDYSENEIWGVLLLEKINLATQAVTVEYLTTEPFQGDTSYGFFLSGTQQMPISYLGNKMYIFTRDNKIGIYTVDQGFVQYNMNYDFTDAIQPDTPLDLENVGISYRSPLRIDDDGEIYIGNVYNDGKIKIHRYNIEQQRFELYWESNNSISSYIENESLQFVSLEIITE